MPKLEVEGVGTFDVPENKRLVLAIEEDAGVDILHRCGSYARCTTCRIEYLDGEPEKMTRAELEVLEKRNLLGQVRLSCQTLRDHDKKVRVLMTVSSTGLDGPGPHPESHITPEPEWVDKPARGTAFSGYLRVSSKGLKPLPTFTDEALRSQARGQQEDGGTHRASDGLGDLGSTQRGWVAVGRPSRCSLGRKLLTSILCSHDASRRSLAHLGRAY